MQFQLKMIETFNLIKGINILLFCRILKTLFCKILQNKVFKIYFLDKTKPL